MRFIARAAVVAALFACLLFRPDAGMAQGEVQRVTAVFCDTQEQMEAVLKETLDVGVPLGAALKTVNDKAGKTACGAMDALVRDQAEVGTVRAGGKSLKIIRAIAVAAVTPGGAVPLPPQAQFFAQKNDNEQGVSL